MDFDDILFWGLLIIGIAAAIAFWPITLAVIIIYFVWKNKKKQEYEEREYKIRSLQNTVIETRKDIEIATNQKVDLRKRISGAQEELARLNSRLADALRFQTFVAAVACENNMYVVPKAIGTLNAQIVAQEDLITKLETEDKSLSSKEERLKSSIEAKNQEISSLQAIQAAQKTKKR